MELDVPFLTREFPGIACRVRESPEDFVVEELPIYGPSGAGEHVLCSIEKREITTNEAIQRLAQALGVPRGGFGYAGLKDAHAVARQQLSIQGADPSAVLALEIPGLRVLAAERHARKLRVGHLRGNRFRIRLRGLEPGREADLAAVLDVLTRRGVPNWFGPQRFGRHGDTWKLGRDLLQGGARKARKRRSLGLLRFYVSAWQSWLFNQVLAARLATFDSLLAGDLAWLHDRGAVFRVDDLEREAPRAAAFEVSPSGPLFGPRMIEPAGEPLAIERAVLSAQGLEGPDLGGPRFLTWNGARRPLRVPAGGLEHAPGHDERGPYHELAFTLPPGAYATALLRELSKGASDLAQLTEGARALEGGDES